MRAVNAAISFKAFSVVASSMGLCEEPVGPDKFVCIAYQKQEDNHGILMGPPQGAQRAHEGRLHRATGYIS